LNGESASIIIQTEIGFNLLIFNGSKPYGEHQYYIITTFALDEKQDGVHILPACYIRTGINNCASFY